MVWELFKGSAKPHVCAVIPLQTGDVEVTCDINPRTIADKEKVCLIEIKDKAYVTCGKGSEIVTRLAEYWRK